jgi:hypothetical protein
VLEAAVHDGAQDLGLEQEVLEAGGVDADIPLLRRRRLGRLVSAAGGNFLRLLLVVDQLFLDVRHRGVKKVWGGGCDDSQARRAATPRAARCASQRRRCTAREHAAATVTRRMRAHARLLRMRMHRAAAAPLQRRRDAVSQRCAAQGAYV